MIGSGRWAATPTPRLRWSSCPMACHLSRSARCHCPGPPRSLYRVQRFLALVDYYNQVELPGHRDGTYEEHSIGVDGIVGKVAEAVKALCGPAEITVRLYGGWF